MFKFKNFKGEFEHNLIFSEPVQFKSTLNKEIIISHEILVNMIYYISDNNTNSWANIPGNHQ